MVTGFVDFQFRSFLLVKVWPALNVEVQTPGMITSGADAINAIG